MTDKIKREISTMKEEEEHYFHICNCINCGASNNAFIRKGVPLSGLTIECDKCGCDIALKPKLR